MQNFQRFGGFAILLTASLIGTTGCPGGAGGLGGLYGDNGGDANDDDDGGNGGGDGAEHTFTAELTGDQEVPPVATNATGSGTFVLNAEGTELSFDVSITAGLSGPVTVAHFHESPVGVSGGVVFEITAFVEQNPDGTVSASGLWELGSGDVEALLAGDIYVNFHTDLHPAGEVRGQLIEE
jgi:hypothetical protein